ncbi:TPA: XRE family transcriptional regulator [Salmonella enterica]
MHRLNPAIPPKQRAIYAKYALRRKLIDTFLRAIAESGLTQAEAAEKCGVSQSYISSFYRKKDVSVSTDKILHMIVCLGKSVTFRVGDNDDENWCKLLNYSDAENDEV